jgi:hypothetical protein
MTATEFLLTLRDGIRAGLLRGDVSQLLPALDGWRADEDAAAPPRPTETVDWGTLVDREAVDILVDAMTTTLELVSDNLLLAVARLDRIEDRVNRLQGLDNI